MMNQSDKAMLVLVALVSLAVAYWLGGIIINSPESRSTKVEIAVPIKADFPEPSTRIFHDGAVNPTKKIEIGEAARDRPFDTSN